MKPDQIRQWNGDTNEWEWVDDPSRSGSFPLAGLVFFVTLIVCVTFLLGLLIWRVT